LKLAGLALWTLGIVFLYLAQARSWARLEVSGSPWSSSSILLGRLVDADGAADI